MDVRKNSNSRIPNSVRCRAYLTDYLRARRFYDFLWKFVRLSFTLPSDFTTARRRSSRASNVMRGRLLNQQDKTRDNKCKET